MGLFLLENFKINNAQKPLPLVATKLFLSTCKSPINQRYYVPSVVEVGIVVLEKNSKM